MKKANQGCYPNTDMKTYLHHSFTITSYSVGVCLELQKALNGLVEKRMTKKVKTMSVTDDSCDNKKKV